MNNWTIEENSALLDAIDEGVSIDHVIDIACRNTNRSETSVKRRLTKMGYLRNCGNTFSRKQGFVR